jgi:hypothetical protein
VADTAPVSALEAAARLPEPDLVERLGVLADRERSATAAFVACLAEFDRRHLHLGLGYESLFRYCTGALRLAEYSAGNRIEAARAARRFPVVLERLADGSLTLSTLRLIAPHLEQENHERLLAEVKGRSRRQVEVMVACLAPLPDVPAFVQKLPVTRPVLAPTSPERYKVQFTVGQETNDKLRRAQDLLRRELPTGDPAAIFDRALTLLLEQVGRRKLAEAVNPRPAPPAAARSRHVPAHVKRAVWQRDAGRCAFVSRAGRRCEARAFLELHHVDPFGHGGETTVENLSLRCRAHNAHESEAVYGRPEGPG